MAEPEQEDEPMTTAPTQLSDTAEKRTGIDTAGPDVDTPDVAPRFVEKKRLHWQDKTCPFSDSSLLSLLTIVRLGPSDDCWKLGMRTFMLLLFVLNRRCSRSVVCVYPTDATSLVEKVGVPRLCCVLQ